MRTNDSPKLLIVDLYSGGGRKMNAEAGASSAGVLFERAVRVHRPQARVSQLEFSIETSFDETFDDDLDGVIWSGSNLTIHRTNPLIEAQIDYCRSVFDRGVPQFGCCYGIQLATMAAGGEVLANPKGAEIGWARDISLNEEGRAHPMFDGKDGQFDALCWHSDTVTKLPDDATLLASNGFSDVQAAIVRRGGSEFWATQYHPEFDGFEVAQLLSAHKDHVINIGAYENAESVEATEAEMRHLHGLEGTSLDETPALKPVVDPKVRTAELGNWLDTLKG